ncbi:MAG: hypothetical protein HYU75_18685, partial [Betaproteobacteria bacterium]|nr:hypothetical protein [Betaproteobacteria bacterium]
MNAPGKRAFRPGIWPSIAALALFALTLALGAWQTRRADEKLAVQQRQDELARAAPRELPALPASAEDYAHRRVSLRGEFVARGTLLLLSSGATVTVAHWRLK